MIYRSDTYITHFWEEYGYIIYLFGFLSHLWEKSPVIKYILCVHKSIKLNDKLWQSKHKYYYFLVDIFCNLIDGDTQSEYELINQ